LAGEFNRWSTHETTPMQRGDEGKWNAHVFTAAWKTQLQIQGGWRASRSCLGVLGFQFNRKFDGRFGVACDLGLVRK